MPAEKFYPRNQCTYYSLPMVFRAPTHGIPNLLLTEYQTPYQWYIEPLPMIYRTPYSWYMTPPSYGILTPTHGISSPLPMVYRTSYSWYFEPPTHGILNPPPMAYRTPYR